MKKACFVLAGFAFAGSAFAQTWQPANGGTWTNTLNWSLGQIPDSDSAQVVLSKDFTASPVPITLDRDSAFTVNKISYDDTGASGDVGCTISPGAGSPAGLVFAGTTPTADVGADLTISAPVDLSQGLTKAGARNVILNGVVTGLGPSVYNTVNAGTLAIGPATTIDWTTISKTAGAGVLRLDALTTLNVPAAFSVGAGELQLNPAAGTFVLHAAGLTKSGAGTLRFNRPVSGSAAVSITGALSLNADNTGSGLTSALTVQSGGTLYAGHVGAIPAASAVSVQGGGTLRADLAGTYGVFPLTLVGTGNLFFRSGGNTTVKFAGPITLSGGSATISSYGVTYNTTLSGVIAGTGPLTIWGQGGSEASHTAKFALETNNTYSGNTTFMNNAGLKEATLVLGVNHALPTNTVLTLSIASAAAPTGVTLDLNGKSQKLSRLARNATAASGKYRVQNGGAGTPTLTLNTTADAAFDGAIGVAGKAGLSLVKQGGATLTLSGTNSVYSGGTTVNAGTLLVDNIAGSGTGTGSVTVDSGATLGGKGTIQGAVSAAADAALLPGGGATVGTLTLQNTLTLNGNTLTFDLSSTGPTNDIIALSGTGSAGVLTLNGDNTLKLNLLGGTLPAGVYTLMTYASKSGGGTLSLDVQSSATLNVGDTSVTLTTAAGGLGANLTWQGDSGNVWDIGSAANWNGGTAAFYDLDKVTFDDTGYNSPDINLTTQVQPSSVVVSNSAKDFTFSGVGGIAGSGSLTKQGTSTLTLACTNAYSGATTVSSGKLALGADDVLGAGAVTVNGAAAVLDIGTFSDTVGTVTLDGGGQITGTSGTLSAADAFELKSGTVSATLSGTVAVNKTTAGTVTLSGTNTYSGGTVIGGGILQVNQTEALGSGDVTFSGGVRLSVGSGVNVTNAIMIGSNAGGSGRGLIEASSNTGTVSGAITINSGAAAGGLFGSVGSAVLKVDSVITSATIPVALRTGTCVFSGGGSYASFLATGTLRIGVDNGLCTNAVVDIAPSGPTVFDLGGLSQELAGLIKSSANSGLLTNSSDSASVLTLNVGGANAYAYSGPIGGNLSLVKSGSGSQTLSGINAYSGSTTVKGGTLIVYTTGTLGANCTNITVEAGTLALSNSVSMADSAMVRVANGGGAKVHLAAGVNESVGYLYFGDKSKYADTYGATGSGAKKIDDEHFSGTGVLTVLHGSRGMLIQLK